ncbi:HlyD family efflux transporter periplasmic adaptor subunit [Frigidibacter sp. RF13]|uniref:HlyD family efflux transporter periplasmic adaptor subunit n=1 Tax=Frigidibacter sp. RF13 TaxID=2997340 RepID=UPI002270D2ED|nr:HlyD family efflux transporter periplasmic adaptor subunit [Frigidibacter sp. RF13]MCY1128733.1 HlyD family efflux transporter periplasmic adaptor subunit [Frigidibacter sp. RF13]
MILTQSATIAKDAGLASHWSEVDHNTNRRDGRVVFLCLVLFCAAVTWSILGTLDRVVRGQGSVKTSTKTQVIQNLEGGIIVKILVGEGDHVRLGQHIVQLDKTNFAAALSEIEHQVAALDLRRQRLEAEVGGSDALAFQPHPDERFAEIARSEVLSFEMRRREFLVTKANYERMAAIEQSELDSMLPLREIAAISELEILRQQQEVQKLQAELDRYVAERERTISEELSSVVNELSALRQTVAAREDQLSRTTIAAPVDGTVNRLYFSTIGGVVKPGEPIVELVPDGELPQIEIRVSTDDISHVSVGMAAKIKVSAFDYARYGTVAGYVTKVSADTIPDEKRRDAPDSYVVTIEPEKSALAEWQTKGRSLRPGMAVTADIKADNTPIIDYLIRPIVKTKDALGEL